MYQHLSNNPEYASNHLEHFSNPAAMPQQPLSNFILQYHPGNHPEHLSNDIEHHSNLIEHLGNHPEHFINHLATTYQHPCYQ